MRHFGAKSQWITLATVSAVAFGSTGCLRQPGAMVAEPKKPPLAQPAAVPVVEDSRPMASFLLNGEPFCFAGTNNYYVTFHSRRMVDDVLEKTKELGFKVIRIWGMIDRGSLDGTVRNTDGIGEKNQVYFQYWDTAKKRPAYNDGPNGLERLDYVLDKAKKLDIRVLPVMVNNWHDFGGMDQYIVWFGLNQHHQFYTDPAVTGAYKDWLAHVIERKNSISGVVYKDDPTIFAWELANEPRCTGAGPFDAPGCTTDTIVQWADQMSTYIKSLDPNHLVAVGDEGFFARTHNKDPQYDGSDGVDHDAFLTLKDIDFGTFHLYPDTWGRGLSWANQWIEDHIQAARRAGKPTILEEYGVVARRNSAGIVIDAERRFEALPRWHEMLLKRGANGALNWMIAGMSDREKDSRGRYLDYDHFTVYADEPTGDLMKTFALGMANDAQACRLYEKYARASTPKSPFVTVGRIPSQPQAQQVSLLDSTWW